jgi:hypothetical protein
LLAIRITEDLGHEVEAFTQGLREKYPWVSLTVSDAVRWLLEDGLKKLERSRETTKPGGEQDQ